jgi:hypothetical protein
MILIRTILGLALGLVAGHVVRVVRHKRHMRRIPQELRALEIQIIGGGPSIEETVERTMSYLRTHYSGGEVRNPYATGTNA